METPQVLDARRLEEDWNRPSAENGGETVLFIDPPLWSPRFVKGDVYVMGARYLRPEGEVRLRFEELASAWEQESLLVASPREAAMHPAYQQIIGLGLQAVPHILRRLGRGRRRWFWALRAITGANPAEGLEIRDAAIAAWMAWGVEHGYLEGE